MSELVWSRVKMILLKHENNTFTHHLNKLLNTSKVIKWRKSFLTRNLLMDHFIKDCEDILMLIPNNACNILFKYIKKLLVCNSKLIFPGAFWLNTNLQSPQYLINLVKMFQMSTSLWATCLSHNGTTRVKKHWITVKP